MEAVRLHIPPLHDGNSAIGIRSKSGTKRISAPQISHIAEGADHGLRSSFFLVPDAFEVASGRLHIHYATGDGVAFLGQSSDGIDELAALTHSPIAVAVSGRWVSCHKAFVCAGCGSIRLIWFDFPEPFDYPAVPYDNDGPQKVPSYGGAPATGAPFLGPVLGAILNFGRTRNIILHAFI